MVRSRVYSKVNTILNINKIKEMHAKYNLDIVGKVVDPFVRWAVL
jgi:hypothetical protein